MHIAVECTTQPSFAFDGKETREKSTATVGNVAILHNNGLQEHT